MSAITSSLRYFGALCDQVTGDSSLLVKQELITGFVSRYTGDLGLLFKLLLPKYDPRLYHLQDKQLIKLFSLVLNVPAKTLKDDVDSTGCIATTVKKFFKPRASAHVDPATGWCSLTLEEFDAHLDALSKVTQEDAQLSTIQKFLNVACKNAVFWYLREIKQDLKLGAGIRVVLHGLHPSANAIFKQCANVQQVVKRVQAGDTQVAEDDDDEAASRPRSPSPGTGRVTKGAIVASIALGMPLSPMLAAPSKGVDQVLTKCPNGAFSETKYDGERIQIHKNGDSFSFFARSTKPMKADKFEGLEPFLHKAIKAKTCILDGEILLMDIATSTPLPFGTLGKHKKAQFLSACTCIVLFDMMYVDDTSLLNTPLDERREKLKAAVQFIPNRVVISEMRHICGTPDQRSFILKKHLAHAIAEGLEGLVIKDVKSVYEPGARHWVKLKKDYLEGMADSADLVVLGAYYGSGNKGGILSTFLMGVRDADALEHAPGRWKTVCKVGNGHDDATLALLNTKYKHTMKAPVNGKAPAWIDIHNSHMPDMFVSDPDTSDVWEIIGAEFSTTKTHTASAISIRFPRVLKRRDDKTPATATSLQELIKIVEASKEKSTRMGLAAELPDDDEEDTGVTTSVVAAAERAPSSMMVVVAPSSHSATDRYSRAHALDDDYAARLAPTLPVDSIEEDDDVDAKHTTTTGVVEYVTSEIAQPLSDAKHPHQNMVILHSTALGGKWSNRGTMGSLTKFLGEEPQEAYHELSRTMKLGEVIFCEVSNRQSSGKLFVGTMIAQKAAIKTGDVPQVDAAALEQCIKKGFAFASKYHASVHLAKLDRVTGVDWGSVDGLLKVQSKEHPGTRILVYSRDGGALGRTKTYAPPTLLPEDHGFTRLTTSASASSVPSPSTAVSAVTPSASRERSSASSSSPASSSLPMQRSESDLVGGKPFMEGCTCYISPNFGLRDAATIQQKLLMTGGSHTKELSTATHVIVTGAHDHGVEAKQVDSVAAKGLPVVLRGWVDDCFVQNRKLPTDPYVVELPRSVAPPTELSRSSGSSGSLTFNALRHARVVLDGFDAKEKEELATKVCMLGGVVQERWKTTGGTGKSTHLISKSWTKETERVSDLGGAVLKRAWIDTALALGALPNTTPFLWHHVDNEEQEQTRHRKASPELAPVTVVRQRAPATEEKASRHGPAVLPPTLMVEAEEDDDSARRPRSPSPLSPVKPTSPTHVRVSQTRHREATPPTVFIMDSLPKSAKHAGKLLESTVFSIVGYSASLTAHIALLLTELGAVVVPLLRLSRTPHEKDGSQYVMCETLTSVSSPLVNSRRLLTCAWLTDVVLAKHWIDPESKAAKYIMGAHAAQSHTHGAKRVEREMTVSDTDDDDDAPPAKSSRVERLSQATAAPKELPPTLLTHDADDSDATETASTVSASAATPPRVRRRGASPASTISDGVPNSKNKEPAHALLPTVLEGIVAIMVPLRAADRDPDTKNILNEARRYIIAYGGDVISSVEDFDRERNEGALHGKRVVLLVPSLSAPIADTQLSTAVAQLTHHHNKIAVEGGIDRAWVMLALHQGRTGPLKLIAPLS